MGLWRVGHGTRLSDFTFTFHFHALEKEMATHPSVLAWRIPGTGEPGGLPSVGSHRVGHDWSDLAAAAAAVHWWTWPLSRKTLDCTACQFPWWKYSHYGWFQATNILTTSPWDLAIGSHKPVWAGFSTPLGMYVCMCMSVGICVYICVSHLCFTVFPATTFLLPKVHSFVFPIEMVCWKWILH